LELQATIHTPFSTVSGDTSTTVGNLVFPLWDPARPDDKAWMKRVYFYVGKHQRLTGEVKQLNKAMAVLGRRGDGEELEIKEIVRHKIVFSSRPEPVGEEMGV
jgi:chromosome transmission fidelity protein 8